MSGRMLPKKREPRVGTREWRIGVLEGRCLDLEEENNKLRAEVQHQMHGKLTEEAYKVAALKENEKLRAELEEANDDRLWQQEQNVSMEARAVLAEKRADAWKELCGRWMRWALKCEEYGSSTYCVEYPPEEPEGGDQW